MSRAAAREESSESKRRLYLAFDLGWTYWKLALTPGPGRKPRLRTVADGSMVEVWREITLRATSYDAGAELLRGRA